MWTQELMDGGQHIYGQPKRTDKAATLEKEAVAQIVNQLQRVAMLLAGRNTNLLTDPAFCQQNKVHKSNQLKIILVFFIHSLTVSS